MVDLAGLMKWTFKKRRLHNAFAFVTVHAIRANSRKSGESRPTCSWAPAGMNKDLFIYLFKRPVSIKLLENKQIEHKKTVTHNCALEL
jgi:hypothetical protein